MRANKLNLNDACDSQKYKKFKKYNNTKRMEAINMQRSFLLRKTNTNGRKATRNDDNEEQKCIIGWIHKHIHKYVCIFVLMYFRFHISTFLHIFFFVQFQFLFTLANSVCSGFNTNCPFVVLLLFI